MKLTAAILGQTAGSLEYLNDHDLIRGIQHLSSLQISASSDLDELHVAHRLGLLHEDEWSGDLSNSLVFLWSF